MKLILDINDNKANFILELLSNFNFVKAKAVGGNSEELSEELKTALNEGVKDLEQGGSLDHKTVMEQTKQKFPNLFK